MKKCPECRAEGDATVRTIDSRPVGDGLITRRRMRCLRCEHRFSSVERLMGAREEELEQRLAAALEQLTEAKLQLEAAISNVHRLIKVSRE